MVRLSLTLQLMVYSRGTVPAQTETFAAAKTARVSHGLSSFLRFYNIHELVVAVYNVVYDAIVIELFRQHIKEFACTRNPRFLLATQLHGRHAALGFCDKVNVLYTSLAEGNSPVGIVGAYRRRNKKSARKLGIHHNILIRVQLFDKAALHPRLRSHIVIDMLLEFLTCNLLQSYLSLRKNIAVIAFRKTVVTQLFNDAGCLLLVDEPPGF